MQNFSSKSHQYNVCFVSNVVIFYLSYIALRWLMSYGYNYYKYMDIRAMRWTAPSPLGSVGTSRLRSREMKLWDHLPKALLFARRMVFRDLADERCPCIRTKRKGAKKLLPSFYLGGAESEKFCKENPLLCGITYM